MIQTKCHSKMKPSKIPWKPFPHDDPSKVSSARILIRAVVDGDVDWYEAEIVHFKRIVGPEDPNQREGWLALVDGPLIPISNITHYCIPSTEVDND